MRQLNSITNNGYEFRQTLGDDLEQRSLACYSHRVAESYDLVTEQQPKAKRDES